MRRSGTSHSTASDPTNAESIQEPNLLALPSQAELDQTAGNLISFVLEVSGVENIIHHEIPVALVMEIWVGSRSKVEKTEHRRISQAPATLITSPRYLLRMPSRGYHTELSPSQAEVTERRDIPHTQCRGCTGRARQS